MIPYDSFLSPSNHIDDASIAAMLSDIWTNVLFLCFVTNHRGTLSLIFLWSCRGLSTCSRYLGQLNEYLYTHIAWLLSTDFRFCLENQLGLLTINLRK